MTHVIDKLMEKVGFEAAEVRRIKNRSYYYAGIISLLTTSFLFLYLTLMA